MGLQTLQLVMAGLGVTGEANDANTLLTDRPPALDDGVHLRWAFSPERGFPWGGFHLYRRVHSDPEAPIVVKPPPFAPGDAPHRPLDQRTVVVPYPRPPGARVSSTILISSDAHLVEVNRPPHGAAFELDGRRYLRFDLLPRENPAFKIVVELVTSPGTVEVTGLCGNVPVTVVTDLVPTGSGTFRAVVESDLLDGVEIRPRPGGSMSGGLVSVTLYEVLAAAAIVPGGWTSLTTEAVRLPVRRPDYPCTATATAEDIDLESTRAKGLVRYGASTTVLPPPTVLTSAGTVTVTQDSPVVVGTGTDWTARLVGSVLRLDGEATVYGVLAVLSATKLLASRPYEGTDNVGVRYTLADDAYGQLYDLCAGLVRGGPAVPMMARTVPPVVPLAGTVSVSAGLGMVTGSGTRFGPDLVGLEFRLVGADEGTVSLTPGSSWMVGDAGAFASWDRFLLGSELFLDGWPTAVRVVELDPDPKRRRIRLERPWYGGPAVKRPYQLVDSPTYPITGVDVANQSLDLGRPYAGKARARRHALLTVRLSDASPSPSGDAPASPRQRPLDLVLLYAMFPAFAQVLGLYWLDGTAVPGTGYDYLLLADYGAKHKDATAALAAFTASPSTQDGYIVFDRGIGTRPYRPLSPPQEARAYDMPASSPAAVDGRTRDANAGLAWKLAEAGVGPLLADRALFFHVWRAALGADQPAPGDVADDQFQLLTGGQPLLVAPTELTQQRDRPRSPRWPPFSTHYLDRALDEGWYAYRVHGIDIFGRHSGATADVPWHQWSPPPSPRPWYYDDAVGDGQVSQPGADHAIRALDSVAPPPPSGVEAVTLDLADPWVQQDAAYNAWLATLSDEERTGAAGPGLRVRWTWNKDQQFQAPDTAEFRIYVNTGNDNALPGRIQSVDAGAESVVTTDIAVANDTVANAYVGSQLLVGPFAYRVTASRAGTPLVLTVRNTGASTATGAVRVESRSAVVVGEGTEFRPEMAGSVIRIDRGGETTTAGVLVVRSKTELLMDKPYGGTPSDRALPYLIHEAPPRSGVQCTLAFSPFHNQGRVTVTYNSRTVRGHDAGFADHLVGRVFQLSGDVVDYRVASVDAGRCELTLDREWAAADATSVTYAIRNPRFVDYSESRNWQTRYYVVPADDTRFFQPIPARRDDPPGLPLDRLYEVLLPNAGDSFRPWLPLFPDLETPIARGIVGVSAVDDKRHALDDPRWTGTHWASRTGNEGRVSAPAGVLRVLRTLPPAPALPTQPPHVFASVPDYHNHCFYTFRFLWKAHLRVHVFRALDETVFAVDWERRRLVPKVHLLKGDPVFPEELKGVDGATAADICGEINALNDLVPLATEEALSHFRTELSDGAIRVMAGLPGNEAAFSQLTVVPLDPVEHPDRAGPDTPDHEPQEGVCAFVDTLDGGSVNRYLYRAIYVDAANNRGGMSFSSAPVHLPHVAAPTTPVLTRAVGGDRTVTIGWYAARDGAVARYHVYRADSFEGARDLRVMEKVHTEPHVPEAPDRKDPEWSDTGVPGGRSFYYRLVAEDAAGHLSPPTEAVPVRAYDLSVPLPPAWVDAKWNGAGTAIELEWKLTGDEAVDTMVIKRSPAGNWMALSGWLPPVQFTFRDLNPTPDAASTYRLRVRNGSGNLNQKYENKDVDALPTPSDPGTEALGDSPR